MEKQQPFFFLKQISPEDWENTPDNVKHLVESLLASAALSESESRLIQFLDATPIGIAVHKSTGQLVYINQIGRALLGIDRPSDLSLDQLCEVFQLYREDTQALYPFAELPPIRALAGETVCVDDLEIHRLDQVIPLEVRATPIFDDQGQVMYAVVAFQDISDRKRHELEQHIVENTLLKSEDRYRQLIQTQTDLILRSLPDTTITFANEALCLALGRSLENVIGMQWNRFVPPEEVDEINRKIAALSPENPTFENTNQDYRSNNQIGWTQWINLGIFDEQGQLVEIQSVGRDVTALRQQIQREQALNRVFQSIRNSLELDVIFATATAETAQLLKNLDCFVVQYLADQGIWRHVAEFCHNPNTPTTIGLEIPDAGNPLADQLKQLQIVCVENTTTLDDEINQEMAQNVPGAWLLIPLVVEGILWGSFTITASQQKFTWSDDQVELAQAIAEQLEIAIQQANLYQQLQVELEERRRVEAALRDSEARFQNMAANVPGVILRYLLRPDGYENLVYMSQGCYRLWEVEAQKALADTSILWQMIHPEDLPEMRAAMMESAQTLQPWISTWRITTPSGCEKWLEAAGRPTRFDNGDVIWDTLILDVSEQQAALRERKQAEEALAASEQRLSTLISNLPGYVYRAYNDPNYTPEFISQGVEAITGYQPQEYLIERSISCGQEIHPDDADSVWAIVQKAVGDRQPYECEYRIITKTGQEKWVWERGRGIYAEDGNLLCLEGFVTDVSDRKAAETALREQDQRLNSILSSIEGIVWSCDAKTLEVLYVSPRVERVYGRSVAEFLANSKLWFEMIHPQDQATTADEIEELRQIGSKILEYRVITADGQIHWVQDHCNLICDADGQPWRIDGIVTDITVLKSTQESLRVSEERLRLALTAANQGLYDLNVQTGDAIVSREYATMLGYDPDTFVETNAKWIERLHPDDHEPVANTYGAYVQGKIPEYRVEFRQRTCSGGWKWILSLGKIVSWDEAGNPLRMLGTHTDISDRKQTEAAMRESEARYRLLAENTNDLVCLHDLNGRFLYVSPSCEMLLGYKYKEMLKQDPFSFIHPDDRDRVRQETCTAVNGSKTTPITYRMRQKSGNYIWFETLTKPIVDTTSQIVQLQTTSRDVTERIQVQNQLKHDALHDALTGLPNRNFLMERLELAINRANRLENYHFAVLFLDLDRFKVINDSLGHLAGDELLIAIAQKLQATLRAMDLAARLGGDEFVILLEEIKDIQEAIRITERIFAQLQTPLIIEGREVYTTSSVGIVLGTKDYIQPSHLLRDADIAMYRAKNNGKARYEIFDTQMHTQALSRLHLENDLRRAIESQEFVLCYQPIVALESRNIVGFEALIRWQHPTKGLKFPEEFIGVAEEIGLITPLDYWAVRTACEQLAAWQIAFPGLGSMKMSINLSAQDLRRPDLLEEIDRILTQTRLHGRCLALEITESMLIQDIESTITLLSQLRERGIQISIDDFGTGYSSLNYLHRLPIDNLKVDRSFVNQIQAGNKNHQIVETIVALSNQLELDAIAEGIETQQQLERLQQLGYKFGQGYLFSKPLSQKQAEELLAKKVHSH